MILSTVMTSVAADKLSFLFITEVVPETDNHRSFEAFMTVFEVHAKFIGVEMICRFQSCTLLETHCR